MDSANQTTETPSPQGQDDTKDDFVPIKVDPTRMNEIMLRLDDRGLEDRLHSDFYDNLIKFGIDKKYIDSMRDDFVRKLVCESQRVLFCELTLLLQQYSSWHFESNDGSIFFCSPRARHSKNSI